MKVFAALGVVGGEIGKVRGSKILGMTRTEPLISKQGWQPCSTVLHSIITLTFQSSRRITIAHKPRRILDIIMLQLVAQTMAASLRLMEDTTAYHPHQIGIDRAIAMLRW